MTAASASSPTAGSALGGVELAQDRRRGGGAERPDRVGAERREVRRRHADGLGHEPGEHAVEVARGEVRAQARLERRVDRRPRPAPERRALVRDDAPDRGGPQARPERDPPAQRVPDDVDRPARLRRPRRLGDGGEVVELALDRRTRRVAVPESPRPRRSMAWSRHRVREVRADDAPRAVVGGRAVDEDQRRPGARGEDRDRRAIRGDDPPAGAIGEGRRGRWRRRRPRRPADLGSGRRRLVEEPRRLRHARGAGPGARGRRRRSTPEPAPPPSTGARRRSRPRAAPRRPDADGSSPGRRGARRASGRARRRQLGLASQTAEPGKIDRTWPSGPTPTTGQSNTASPSGAGRGSAPVRSRRVAAQPPTRHRRRARSPRSSGPGGAARPGSARRRPGRRRRRPPGCPSPRRRRWRAGPG